MKTALIPPTPDLERFAGGDSMHMMLAQHCEPRYLEFYTRERARGAYVILDNGADELWAGVAMPRLLNVVNITRAQEVVLPDVQCDGPDTVATTQNALKWLERDGQEAYQRAGEPTFMIVPQGVVLSEWRTSMYRMLKACGDRPPVIGVAKNHDDLIVGGLHRCLSWIPDGYVIHLLGWPRRLITLREVAEKFPEIRSVDSARPLKLAMTGRLLHDERGLPTRVNGTDGVHYFEDSVPMNYEDIARTNIKTFRSYALDV